MPEMNMIIVNNSAFDMNCIMHLHLPGALRISSAVWWSGVAPAGEKIFYSFDDGLCVVLADKADSIFSVVKKADAKKKTTWKINIAGDSEEITINPSSPSPKYDNEIRIENRSGSLLTVGIGMNNVGALFQEEILSGANASFNMTPEYSFAVLNEGVDAPVSKEVQTRSDSGTETSPIVRRADMMARKSLNVDALHYTYVTLEGSEEEVIIKCTSVPKS